MEQETKTILAYDKICEMLESRAGSILGKERARHMEPETTLHEANRRLDETDEAIRIAGVQIPPFGGIFDLRPSMRRVELGAVAELGELADVLSTMRAMRAVKRYFKELEIDAPLLKSRAVRIEILGEFERSLSETIDDRGAMADTASVELSRIRRELRSLQARIKERMNSVIHSAQYQKYFQDAIITMRDGRYVVPVKQEYRNAFPGIVHDQSATGATIYVEPMSLVDDNNKVRELEAAERNEVERILRKLSDTLRKLREPLTENTEILAALDFVFAKARLANDMRATRPQLNDEGKTHIREARHPLLPAETVVPVDIVLGESYRILLITGPNTGGKTVSLKTLGLFAMMAQSGCYVPTAAGAVMAVYPRICTVIGDEQSMEQSLSTFSGHMKHIVALLESAEADDLLLFDEIGSGTDPEEGAALAMAIIEELLSIGVSAVVTTHYSELKTFAYATEGIENASVEFDVETLRPTYRLLIGTPGASNAFAISRRLGLSEAILQRAEAHLKEEHARFEDVVNRLDRERRLYEDRNLGIEETKERVEKLEAKLIRERDNLAKKKEETLRKARQEGAALVRQARREAEELIKALKEQFNDQGIAKRQKAMEEARRKLKARDEALQPGLVAGKTYKQPVHIDKIKAGDIVYVRKLDQKATVLSVQGKELELSLGTLKLMMKAKDCRFVEGAKPERSVTRNIAPATGKRGTAGALAKTAQIRAEIDLRGMMVDEAEEALDKYIDDALLSGLSNIRIIHGLGTGALRKGVQEYLKKHKNVVRFQYAGQNEGGLGATNVELI